MGTKLTSGSTVPASASTDSSGPIHYDPQRYLQGLAQEVVRQATRREQAVHVEGPWPAIALFPTSQCAIVAGDEEELQAYASEPDLLEQAKVTFTPAPRFRPHHPSMLPLDALIWRLALSASGGRLPSGTDPQLPCGLRDWQAFTRLTVVPTAISIAALWARDLYTFDQTVELLGVPARDVFAFYSAAFALGLVTHQRP